MTANTNAALLANLWEAIGYHSAQVRETGHCAPGDGLISAMDAVKAAISTPAQPPALNSEQFWPVDENASRKQLIELIGRMNFQLSALRQENAGLIRRNQGQAEALRNYQRAAAPKATKAEPVPQPDIGAIVKALMHTARQDVLNWEGRLALGRAIAILQAVQAHGIQPAHKEQPNV